MNLWNEIKFRWGRWRAWRKEFKNLKPGVIIQNCTGHLGVVVNVDKENEDVTSISLFNGELYSCSIFHCGVWVVEGENFVNWFFDPAETQFVDNPTDERLEFYRIWCWGEDKNGNYIEMPKDKEYYEKRKQIDFQGFEGFKKFKDNIKQVYPDKKDTVYVEPSQS